MTQHTEQSHLISKKSKRSSPQNLQKQNLQKDNINYYQVI